MTVIAWDGSTLAADGLLTNGGAVASTKTQKIFRESDDNRNVWTLKDKHVLAFGFAGTYGAQHSLIEALRIRLVPHSSFVAELAFTAIMITDEGEAWMVDKSEGETYPRMYQLISEEIALGSGADAAQGALLAGQSSIDAVEIANRCNVYCGGDIQHWTPRHIVVDGKRKLETDHKHDQWMTHGRGK